MTVAKLRKLANAAGYEIKRGFIHSEEGSRKAGQSGYELISMETGEAVTHSACGETWHFAYTLDEVESFLQDVYKQAGMNWEPETGATLEDIAKATVKLNGMITDFCKQSVELNGELTQLAKSSISSLNALISSRKQDIDEEKRIRMEAYSILDRNVPMDADIKLEDCLEMFNKVERGLKAEWDNVIGDTYELRLKLFLILQVLNTSNMNVESDGAEFDYTDSLNGLAEEIVKCKIRCGELEQEVADASAE